MTTPLEHPIASVSLADGLWLEDDWYALKRLDADTLAIGEPAYHQCNWSYLISDGGESLLWDTGSGRRALAPLIARHAPRGVTAMPSHLHYDHLGAVCDFGPVLLADLPILRALENGGTLTPTEDIYLGAWEGLRAPTFAVGRWVRPGETLAIGARRLELLHTPGHSPDSVSLWEPERHRLYAADLVYPGPLYAQIPGANLRHYADTLRRLVALLSEDVEIVCAHGATTDGVHDAPGLGFGDLEDALVAIDDLLTRPPDEGALHINDHMSLFYAPASFVP